MITLLDKGEYKLIETKGQVKILYLRDHAYAWVFAHDIGEILVASHRPHKIDHVLAMGAYRLYDVEDDPEFSDHQHLELFVGNGQWQGYLLLTGLPADDQTKRRIIPTAECITRPHHARV
jgi:hypothetical protein